MKTSSSRAGTSFHDQAGASVKPSIAARAPRGPGRATRSARPKTAALSTPGACRSFRATGSISSPIASNTTRCGVAHHFVGRALHDQPAAGKIDDAVAALGLVHVVGRDEHGHALGGHVVDQVPEFAARLRRPRPRSARRAAAASAGAGCRRRAPSAASSRRKARRASWSARSARPMRSMHSRSRRSRARHPVDVGEKVQILPDGQVVVQAERAGSCSRPGAGSPRSAGSDVEAEARAAPPSGFSRPHSMRMVVVLPLPFAPEEPADLAFRRPGDRARPRPFVSRSFCEGRARRLPMRS